MLVKSNPGQSTHQECGDRGYKKVGVVMSVPDIRVGEAHTLRADIDDTEMRIHADGVEVWKGKLPEAATAFDGPVGTRTDNGEFDFELRVPGGARSAAACSE